MPITFSKYVDITSAVGGVAQATARELILRLMTTSVLIPTESVVEFDTLAEVGTYFGTTSDEYLQATFYFGFVSKLATSPTKISYARYSLVDTAPLIIGESKVFDVSDFDSISDATFTITLGAIQEDIVVDFTVPSVVLSLAAVATRVEDAIQAANVAAVYASCTVVYDAVESRFDFTGGDVGDLPIAIEPTGSGTDLSPIIGWEEPTARFSDGIAAETLTSFLTASTALSNNFGSFAFVGALSSANVLEIAIWNDGENVKFMYLQRVSQSTAQTIVDLIDTLSGTGLTLQSISATEFPWLAPGSVMAATPYSRRASVQNYMFQQFSLTASVTTDALSDFYDGIKVNYYGVTQQAGSDLAFYQRGFLMGLATDPIDMGVYANEVFLKDSIGVSIMNLLLAVSAVPANASGIAQVLASIQAPIELALFNGSISVGKTLNATQVAFVTSITGDPNAYIQIQNSGYWITAVIEESGGEFKVVYTLIYSKNDTVRKVEGSHLLI